MRGVSLVLLCGLLACSSAPQSPFFGDERFLVVGVSPDAEADAIARSLGELGYRESLRLRGRGFAALAFEDAQGLPAHVRIVTGRGIALALDVIESNPLDRGARYALIAPQTPGQFDADDDGVEELLVLGYTYDRMVACALAYRVDPAGAATELRDAEHIRALLPADSPYAPCAADAADAGEPEPEPEPEPEAPAPATSPPG
jgi:hypothetical protein